MKVDWKFSYTVTIDNSLMFTFFNHRQKFLQNFATPPKEGNY